MKTHIIVKSAFLLLLIVGTIYAIRVNQTSGQWHKSEGMVFGTVYHFTYQSQEPYDSLLLEALKQVDYSLSMFNDSSTVSRVNSNRSDVSDALLDSVFALAQRVSAATYGAFDVTVAPLVNAWGFGRKRGILPDSCAIDSLLQLVGWQNVNIIGGHVIKKDCRIVMDFSAIAKGFGCDQVARALDALGVDNYMIEIGGEVVVRGHNPKGEDWRVGVVIPSDDISQQGVQTIVPCYNEAMATSGNYRNYYDEGGLRVSHTISPFTGYPVQHTLLSATVFAPTCAEADAFATAFMVMGMDSARAVLEQNKQLRAYFIYDAGDSLGTWKSFPF